MNLSLDLRHCCLNVIKYVLKGFNMKLDKDL